MKTRLSQPKKTSRLIQARKRGEMPTFEDNRPLAAERVNLVNAIHGRGERAGIAPVAPMQMCPVVSSSVLQARVNGSGGFGQGVIQREEYRLKLGKWDEVIRKSELEAKGINVDDFCKYVKEKMGEDVDMDVEKVIVRDTRFTVYGLITAYKEAVAENARLEKRDVKINKKILEFEFEGTKTGNVDEFCKYVKEKKGKRVEENDGNVIVKNTEFTIQELILAYRGHEKMYPKSYHIGQGLFAVGTIDEFPEGFQTDGVGPCVAIAIRCENGVFALGHFDSDINGLDGKNIDTTKVDATLVLLHALMMKKSKDISFGRVEIALTRLQPWVDWLYAIYCDRIKKCFKDASIRKEREVGMFVNAEDISVDVKKFENKSYDFKDLSPKRIQILSRLIEYVYPQQRERNNTITQESFENLIINFFPGKQDAIYNKRDGTYNWGDMVRKLEIITNKLIEAAPENVTWEDIETCMSEITSIKSRIASRIEGRNKTVVINSEIAKTLRLWKVAVIAKLGRKKSKLNEELSQITLKVKELEENICELGMRRETLVKQKSVLNEKMIPLLNEELKLEGDIKSFVPIINKLLPDLTTYAKKSLGTLYKDEMDGEQVVEIISNYVENLKEKKKDSEDHLRICRDSFGEDLEWGSVLKKVKCIKLEYEGSRKIFSSLARAKAKYETINSIKNRLRQIEAAKKEIAENVDKIDTTLKDQKNWEKNLLKIGKEKSKLEEMRAAVAEMSNVPDLEQYIKDLEEKLADLEKKEEISLRGWAKAKVDKDSLEWKS